MRNLMRWFCWVSLGGLAISAAAIPGLAAQDSAEQARKVEFAAPLTADPLLAIADAKARIVLSSRGYEIIKAAPLRIELALSRRPNDVGLRSDARDNAVPIVSKPGGRRIDLCKDAIYRLVIAQIETRTGAVNYRGTAELRRCGTPSKKDLTKMVNQALVGLR